MDKEIKEKIENIQKTFKERLALLRNRRDEAIKNYRKRIQEKKLEKVRNSLGAK